MTAVNWQRWRSIAQMRKTPRRRWNGRWENPAAALLLKSKIGDTFDAIVTGASDKGTWVRIFHPPVEGKLEGAVSGLDVGKRVRVTLVSTDVERGFIDFRRVG